MESLGLTQAHRAAGSSTPVLSLSRGRTGNKAGGINQIASCPVPPCPAAAIFYLQLNKERRGARARAVYNFPISEMRLHPPHPFSAHFARGKRDRGIPRRQTVSADRKSPSSPLPLVINEQFATSPSLQHLSSFKAPRQSCPAALLPAAACNALMVFYLKIRPQLTYPALSLALP